MQKSFYDLYLKVDHLYVSGYVFNVLKFYVFNILELYICFMIKLFNNLEPNIYFVF